MPSSEQADPAFNSVMPMRVPEMWASAVLQQHPSPGSTPRPRIDYDNSKKERNMHDSYCELVLPFGSSPKLLEQYTNVHGGIRMGMLMESLDSLAGSISYKHMLGPTVESLGSIEERGFYIVTASVDRLDMLSALDPSRDLRLSGQVIYTGRSSMEVAVKMETIGNGPEETVLLGRFSMVCRDAVTHKARDVHPLIISTPEEQALHSMGEDLRQRRQSQALRALSRVPPSSAEAEALHSYYLQHGEDSKDSPRDRVWMGDTKLEKCMLMFPQERNVHQKIFGGYLMRLAYELGFSNSSLFMRGGHVRFLSLDGIAFREPVPIGSILRLTSHVLHSTHSEEFPLIVHVGVTANVVDVETGEERTTNEFRFTWCRDEEADKVSKRKVVPKTYKEAMLWLEGKRALEIADEIRGLRTRDASSGNFVH
ncbi:Thioesterase/thiol ester dehydrase-isomerase [Mycena amicta]|nr:Thioesterase/thiol ester dehydrase-isomerase [Mycena amicta]